MSEHYLQTLTLWNCTVSTTIILLLLLSGLAYLGNFVWNQYVWLFIGTKNVVQYYIDKKGREEAIRKVKSIHVVSEYPEVDIN